MSADIIYNNCPACHRDAIAFQLKAKDFTVSGDVFEIWECNNCGLRFTQNIPSANSIGRYYQSENYISHSNTSKGLINRLYHSVRAITLRQKARLLRNTTGLSTGTLLDIGAGTGAFAAFMRSEGWRVTALEPDESARTVAREQNNICLLSLNEFFSLPEASFDAITMWHVLEHVHALHEYLEQLKKLLSTNGRAFIAVPNYTSYDAAFYKEYWAAYDVPRHLYHFSPKAMKMLVEKHGLKLAGVRPMWFDSFYVSLLSEKYRTGKQNLFRGAWTGLLSNINAIRNNENCSSLIYIISA